MQIQKEESRSGSWKGRNSLCHANHGQNTEGLSRARQEGLQKSAKVRLNLQKSTEVRSVTGREDGGPELLLVKPY